MGAEGLAKYLNQYLSLMARIIQGEGGDIFKVGARAFRHLRPKPSGHVVVSTMNGARETEQCEGVKGSENSKAVSLRLLDHYSCEAPGRRIPRAPPS